MTEGERTDVLAAELRAHKALMDERDRRYEERFRSMDEKTQLALTSSEKAVTKAETATEKRFEGVNEFRETLSDQANTFLPRTEYASNHQGLVDKMETIKEGLTTQIVALRESRSASEGKTTLLSGPWGPVGIIIVLIGIVEIVVLWKH